MKRAKKKTPFARFVRLCILVLFVAALYISIRIPFVAERVFARGITRGASLLLSRLTNYIPVSFYEWTALALIVGAAALVVYIAVLLCKRRFARLGLCFYRLATAALSVLFAFGVLYAPLYNRDSAVGALGLSETEITEEKLFSAAEFFVGRLNAVSESLERDEAGNIIPPYTFSEVAELLGAEFDKLDSGYFAGYEVRPKEVVLSVPMSYLGITGIYFPFYAEANVNVNIPAYELPNTMAHEMAHAKGVSREDEANIVSYTLCVRAEDAYLNYSGLMRVTASLLNSLPSESYYELRERLSPEILREYRNASEHYAKYEGVIDRISSMFNNLFLKANGVSSGTRSYSETTRSLVALYEQLKDSRSAPCAVSACSV